MSRIRLRQLHSIGVLLSSNLIAAIVIASGTLLVSRIVAPSAFGQYSYAAQVAVAIYPALTLRFEQALPLLGKRNLAGSCMLLGTLALAVLTSLLLFLIGVVGLPILVDMLALGPELRELFPLVVLMAFSLSLAGIYQSASLTRGNLSRMAVARVLRAVAMVALQVLVVLVIGGGATWLLLADLGASLMQAMLLAGGIGMAGVWGLFRWPLRQLTRRLWGLAKRHKAFPLITLPHLLVHSMVGLLYTSILGMVYGAAILGQYYLMRKLVYGVLALFSTAIYQHAIAESTQVQREEIYSVVQRALILVGVVTSVSAIMILFAGPLLFTLAVGEEWTMAGRMAMATLPLILMEPITSTLAFVPVFLGLQRSAFGVAVLQGVVGVTVLAGAGAHGLNILPALTVSSSAMSVVMFGYVAWLAQRAKLVAKRGAAWQN